MVGRLQVLLAHQLPAYLEAIPKLAIDLELRSPGEPGFSRRPDLVVVREEGGVRLAAEGGLVRASEVVLVIEIVAHGSRRIDRVDKRQDYADADVPYY